MKDIGYISSYLAIGLFFIISILSLILFVLNYLYTAIILLLSPALIKMSDRKEQNNEMALIIIKKIANATSLFMIITLGIAVLMGLTFISTETNGAAPLFITLKDFIMTTLATIGMIIAGCGIIGIIGMIKMDRVIKELNLFTHPPEKELKKIIWGIIITILMGVSVKWLSQDHALAFALIVGFLSYKIFTWYQTNWFIAQYRAKETT